MTKQPSETTQFALLGKDISQIQKDLSSLSSDVKALVSARFVTQNELTLAMSAMEVRMEEKNKTFKMLGSAVITAIVLAILAAIMNQILK